jgi:predicted phage-related endonuclease
MADEIVRPEGKDRRSAWLAARREVVTATGLASIMRIPDAYGSPMGEWLEKMGRSEQPAEPIERMIWGQRLQQAILVGYAEREGQPIELVDEYELARSTTCKHLGASLDARLQGGDRRPIDAKNIGYQDPVVWGEPYTDQVPPRLVVQLHGQMEVTGAPIADLAALFGGNRLVIYRVERDEKVISACREAATDFWERHVVPDVPPPVDGSDEWTRFLRSRAQRFEKYLDVKDLDPDSCEKAVASVNLLALAKEAKKDAEALEALHGNRLRDLIGENAGLVLPGSRLHYRQNKPSSVADDDGYIAYLERLAYLAGAKPKALRRIRARRFTGSKPGNRPLILKTAKEAKQS